MGTQGTGNGRGEDQTHDPSKYPWGIPRIDSVKLRWFDRCLHDIAPTLQMLNLGRTGVDEDEFKRLCPRLLVLVALNISETNLTDLGPLEDLKRLKLLNISKTEVCYGFQALTHLHNLVELNASDCHYFRKVEVLAGLTYLTKLNIVGTYVSEESVAKLKEKLPKLMVYRNDLNPDDFARELTAAEATAAFMI